MSAVRHARSARPAPSGRPSGARGPGPRGSGPRAERNRRRRRRARARSVRRAAILVGTVITVVGGTSTALGYIGSVSRDSGFATIARQVPPQPARAGTGLRGLFPGGPSMPAHFQVRNPGPTPLTVLALSPAPESFPATCPLTMWTVTSPLSLPTIPAHGNVTVTVQVTLRPQAAASCRAAAGRFTMTVAGTPA